MVQFTKNQPMITALQYNANYQKLIASNLTAFTRTDLNETVHEILGLIRATVPGWIKIERSLKAEIEQIGI